MKDNQTRITLFEEDNGQAKVGWVKMLGMVSVIRDNDSMIKFEA